MDRSPPTDAFALALAPQAKRLAWTMAGINLLLPVVLLVQARVSGEDYATLFRGPESALTWFASVQLAVMACVAYLIPRLGAGDARPTVSWRFWGLAVLFALLSVYEMFRTSWWAPAAADWRTANSMAHVVIRVGWLWAQLLILLALLRRLGAGDPGEAAHAARREIVRVGAAVVAINLILPAGFLIYAGVRDESFYELFWYETDVISWFSGLQLLAVGVVAYANRQLVLAGRRYDPGSSGRGWVWAVFAAGFVFLGLDERFELHELLREGVIAPGGWFVDMPFIKDGDVVLYLYLGVGLGFTYFLLREIAPWRAALILFVAALAISSVIVVVDSLNEELIARWLLPGFWDSAFEEVGEIWAQLLFLLSFLTVLHGRLGHAILSFRQRSMLAGELSES